MQYKKIAQECSQKTYIALGKRQCFNWFIVLAGLFEKIAKVLLRAIEWELTRKICSFALADHLKTICLS